MAGIYSQGGSAGHRYAGWLSEVEAKNFTFGGKVFNGSPSAIYVGSNLVWFAPGLTGATQRAILGAFGQRDGKAVINATNAYLNQLAASDRDKATALAGFINEDPMMVCSLGLEVEGVTMPIRWLVGDGNSWVVTNMQATSTTWTEVVGNKVVWGGTAHEGFTGNTGDSMSSIGYIAFQKLNNVMYAQALTINEYIRGPFDDYGRMHTYKIENNNFYIDNNAFGSTRGSVPNYHADGLMSVFRTMSFNPIKGDVAKAKFWNTNEQVNLIPFKSATREGMVDLVNAAFHPNQGTGHFTDAYTLQDGVTPWTPSTP